MERPQTGLSWKEAIDYDGRLRSFLCCYLASRRLRPFFCYPRSWLRRLAEALGSWNVEFAAGLELPAAVQAALIRLESSGLQLAEDVRTERDAEASWASAEEAAARLALSLGWLRAA